MPISVDLLRSHSFLDGLSENQLSRLAELAGETTYPAGSYILRKGEMANALFLVQSGKVALEVDPPGKTKLVLDVVGGGDILGFAWLSPPYRWVVDARAVETARVIVIDSDGLRGKMSSDPAFGYAIAERLLVRMHERLQRDRDRRIAG